MPDPSPLCPSRAEFRVAQLAVTDDLIMITAVARRAAVRCPACGTRTTRVHSRYVRMLADLPWQGVRVRLRATVRRFFCDLPRCPRRIFAEPVPDTAARYARRTARAATLLEVLGFTVGGRAGARLAERVGVGCAPGTVLAQVRAAVDVEGPRPRVLGVDDWAYRRGQRYGTILVDFERHRVVDLLPDGDVATFAAWLRAHPGVEIISRDRGGAYADGGRLGAPAAIQVADRFHLVHNLIAALERACVRHHGALREAAQAIGAVEHATPQERRERARVRAYSALPNNQRGPTHEEQESAERRARRLARYEHVVALFRQGRRKAQIARLTGLSRRTVIAWLATGHFPERAPRRRPAPRSTDRVMPDIAAFYDTGGTNATALARTLIAQGYGGSVASVRRALAHLRATRPPACAAGVPPPVPVPSVRTVAWLLRRPDAICSPEQRAYLAALAAVCPALGAARALALRFTAMLARREPSALAGWLADAEQSVLRGLAAGLRRDHDAVLAALCFAWSNGQVEGHVHRLKLVKRSMYGRAGFRLLRARVLHAA